MEPEQNMRARSVIPEQRNAAFPSHGGVSGVPSHPDTGCPQGDQPPGRAPAGSPSPSSHSGAPGTWPDVGKLSQFLVIAIDGWAQTGKNSAGELVAAAIGGVVVDSGRFYRALTSACLAARIDLNDPAALATFCRAATLEYRFARDGGRVEETLVWVNGVLYTKQELNLVGAQTTKVAGVGEVREKVNQALRDCARFGRVVMLGRDIGSAVFPETPFKFFLSAPEHVLEERHRRSTGKPGASGRNEADRERTLRAEDALQIDTGPIQATNVSDLILQEVFRLVGKGQRGATCPTDRSSLGA